MNLRQRLVIILAAVLFLLGSFPVFAKEAETDFPVPDEAPAFQAHIEFRMGYTVIGTFTDFTPDITLIQTLYSLDGENWQTGTENWNLSALDAVDESRLHGLQNQPCLLCIHEPLKSYIAGEIDRFYLKLRITKQNGLSYETQAATIERGGLQSIPEETQCRAWFSSSVAVRKPDPDAPYGYRRCGRYQLTVFEDATAEEIAALLPDTLPVEVQLDGGADFMAIGIVDCPVTWKPVSLSWLSAGESITISDAAEEILLPGGTSVSTPLGIFSLEEPLSLNNPPSTDEVELILNVSLEERNPTGVLKEDTDGLKIALHQKPTGATSIQAYVLTEGESNWTSLFGLSLLKELNTQPSTENSGYALLLRNDQEPYQSYLAAQKAGTTPTPFFVGLKIEGGIYDGKQLILSWPDTYEQLPELPKFGGAEGNEGNAGAANKDDSTESGQRPNLPQAPDSKQEEPPSNPAPAPDDSEQQQSAPPQIPKTDSGTPQEPSTSSTEETVSEHSSEHQENPLIPEQSHHLPQTAPNTAEGPAANQKNRITSAPFVMQQAKRNDEESTQDLSGENAPREPVTETDSRIPLALGAAAAVVVTGCCLGGAAVGKATEYRWFRRIAEIIRTLLRR